MSECLREGCHDQVKPGAKFCSRSCSAIHHNLLAPKRSLSKKCSTCPSLIPSNRTFCKTCQSEDKHLRQSSRTEDEIKRSNSNGVVSFRRRVKEKLIEYKGGCCERCGYSKCSDALEFHHVDPSEKEFSVSGKSISFEKMKKEVDKCILVCSNCHREIHFELRNPIQ